MAAFQALKALWSSKKWVVRKFYSCVYSLFFNCQMQHPINHSLVSQNLFDMDVSSYN